MESQVSARRGLGGVYKVPTIGQSVADQAAILGFALIQQHIAVIVRAILQPGWISDVCGGRDCAELAEGDFGAAHEVQAKAEMVTAGDQWEIIHLVLVVVGLGMQHPGQNGQAGGDG